MKGVSTFFFDFTAAYTSLALFVIPVFSCVFKSCSLSKSDNYHSISATMHTLPLATAFAYFGALWLFVILYYQTQRHNAFRYILALLAAKFLSVPLIIPLNSVNSNNYHNSFVFVGAAFEIFYALSVIIEHANLLQSRKGIEYVYTTFAVQIAAFLFGLIIFFAGGTTPIGLWSLFVIEYVFGTSTVIQAKVVQYFHL